MGLEIGLEMGPNGESHGGGASTIFSFIWRSSFLRCFEGPCWCVVLGVLRWIIGMTCEWMCIIVYEHPTLGLHIAGYVVYGNVHLSCICNPLTPGSWLFMCEISSILLSRCVLEWDPHASVAVSSFRLCSCVSYRCCFGCISGLYSLLIILPVCLYQGYMSFPACVYVRCCVCVQSHGFFSSLWLHAYVRISSCLPLDCLFYRFVSSFTMHVAWLALLAWVCPSANHCHSSDLCLCLCVCFNRCSSPPTMYVKSILIIQQTGLGHSSWSHDSRRALNLPDKYIILSLSFPFATWQYGWFTSGACLKDGQAHLLYGYAVGFIHICVELSLPPWKRNHVCSYWMSTAHSKPAAARMASCLLITSVLVLLATYFVSLRSVGWWNSLIEVISPV